MDLQDQLKNLFPDHVPSPEEQSKGSEFSSQEDPLICKYEKRKGKPITIVEDFQGSEEEFKQLAKKIKSKLGVGGSVKNGAMIIQGDYRKVIMEDLKAMGFKVKRVGG